MKPLVIIPARGGSKGVPRKNIKLLDKKPLILYTIDAVRSIYSDEIICVSTDDKEIAETVEKIGLKVPFIRPAELATDTASSYDVIIHAIHFYETEKKYFPDTVVLLQPTSPFRTARHIKEALACYDNTCEMVVSVKETKANPYYTLREEDANGFLQKSKKSNYTRRQDCPRVYELNGAIYIADVEVLKRKPFKDFTKVRKYVMDEFSSHDIDTSLDWDIAKILSEKIIKKN
jgi:N-acylneuraminate cytidylyltransferase